MASSSSATGARTNAQEAEATRHANADLSSPKAQGAAPADPYRGVHRLRTCVAACPEGDVLAVIDGKATIVNGHKCIGHGLCAEECPVGAISMVMAKPSSGADLPVISEEYETSVANLFIVGELGGLALIKNAVNQGRDCIDVVAQRLGSGNSQPTGGSEIST